MPARAGRIAVLGLAVGAVVVAGPVASSQGWSDQPWYVLCERPADCEPANEVYEILLEDASVWLDGLGFGPPKLTIIEGRNDVFLASVDDSQTIEYQEEDNPHPGAGVYWSTSNLQRLFLNSQDFFTMGDPGQTHEDDEYRVDQQFEFTPVHELFHAIQFGYQGGLPGSHRWIWEGMANAVLGAYTLRFEAELGVEMSMRSFSQPLHLPPAAEDSYRTWAFWLGVGRNLGSEAGIAYLKDVLEEDLSDNFGLDGVDRALPGGLATQLPEFFADLPLLAFEPEEESVSLPAGQRLWSEKIPLQVEEVAGKGVQVEASAPAGESVTVQFALEPSHPDLHLIVDGQVHAQRTAHYELPQGGMTSYDVVVANVAEQAADSEPRDPELRVTLMTGGCSMWAEVSGASNRTFKGDVAYFNAFEDGQGVETGLAAGTGVDPGMHDQLQGMMGSIEGLVKLAESMGYEVDEEVKRKVQSEEGEESEAVRETKAWEQELLHSGSDTFGLTLQSIDLEDDSGMSGLGALLGGGFNLGASGEHDAPQGPGLAGVIDFEPSMVYATAAVVDRNSEAVKFIWEPGEPGYATVILEKPTDAPLIYGTLEAELYAKGTYDGERPKIHVRAGFKALQGVNSCMR